MRRKSVDGIILASGLISDTAVKQLIDHQIPVAVIARDLPVLAVNAVLVDDFAGGYMAASHLLSLGHRRIGVVAEDLRLLSSQERVRGYRHALEEAGVAIDDGLVRVSDFTIEGGRRAALELLQLPDRPTALFACNDLLAIGAMRAAKELGLAIPEDLSVVGFDNTILAEIVDPGLTTVAQPIVNMGRQVVDLLIEEMQGEEKPARRVVLLPRLVERNSTAPARS